jgi:hypothetical protein
MSARPCAGRGTRQFLLPGDAVEIRDWSEIRASLDEDGTLDGLPFMREMKRFCGRRFVVSKRIERTCEEIGKQMRRIHEVVFLDELRCDGVAHGGCQKGCFLMWKEAWLKRVDDHIYRESDSNEPDDDSFPYPHVSLDSQYVCQSTELASATAALPWWDVGMVLRDIRAKTYSSSALFALIARAILMRLIARAMGKSYRHLEGTRTRTPTQTLRLRSGEWVKVRSREEIVDTLDRSGKNRGLVFTVEMVQFCGGTYRVLRRLEKMINEPTRRLVDVQDTVILENVVCDGCHIARGGCPRANYHFWREIWLERVSEPRVSQLSS